MNKPVCIVFVVGSLLLIAFIIGVGIRSELGWHEPEEEAGFWAEETERPADSFLDKAAHFHMTHNSFHKGGSDQRAWGKLNVQESPFQWYAFKNAREGSSVLLISDKSDAALKFWEERIRAVEESMGLLKPSCAIMATEDWVYVEVPSGAVGRLLKALEEND